jgi:phosphatidylethanolamine N-methyltransferase
MSLQPSPSRGSEGLRERNFPQTIRDEVSSGGSSGLDTPETGDDVEKEKKTFGRTPSGTSELDAGGVESDIGSRNTVC